MQSLRTVGFGLDCADPASPQLMQVIALVGSLLVVGAICAASIYAARTIASKPLRYGLMAVIIAVSIGIFMFVYVSASLLAACGTPN